MRFFGTKDVAAAPDQFEVLRRRMVERQLRARGIGGERILEVMGRIPRERFVLPEDREHAYHDGPLSIGQGATISQPFIVALMTEAMQPGPEDRILEVGTGSGYQTAILAELAAEVFTIEIEPELAEGARSRLLESGYANVSFRAGDGRRGWPEEAPFDGILLTAAPARLPQALLEQLAPGGRLVAPIGGVDQFLELWRRDGTEISHRILTAVRFVPLQGDDSDAP